MMHARRRWLAIGLCLLSGVAIAQEATDADTEDIANRIKAAFLYHFCNYIHWPQETFATAESPLVIGVAGPDAIVQTIDAAVTGRRAHGRAMVVRKVAAQEDLDGVHLLYVHAAMASAAATFANALDNHAVLVVTDGPAGLDAGGAISFVIENDKVRFDVALDAARQRGLQVSAQLLTVAREIRGSGS